MAWSSDDEDRQDTGTTLEANRSRLQRDRQQLASDGENELWTLYRAIMEYCQAQGYPFLRRLEFGAFVDFAMAHT